MADPKSGEPKSGEAHSAGATSGGTAEPSMDEILASIRRILSEEETPPPAPSSSPNPKPGVLMLDPSMMVAEEPHVDKPDEPAAPAAPPPAAAEPAPAPTPIPAPAPTPRSPERGGLVAPEAAAAAAQSVGALVRQLGAERSAQVSRGGPTIEDLVREELRPLVKQWLDVHLPPMVERVVRSEIERVVGRAVD